MNREAYYYKKKPKKVNEEQRQAVIDCFNHNKRVYGHKKLLRVLRHSGVPIGYENFHIKMYAEKQVFKNVIGTNS